MKIRSQEEFVTFVDERLAWRRKEIATINALIHDARDHQKQVLIRAGVALLYAHWEGFIKEAASAYCAFVRDRRMSLDHLQPSFVAVILRSMLRRSQAGKRIGPYVDAATIMLREAAACRILPADNVIDTESNLTYEVFADIALTIGLDVADFATKANLIDEGLLVRRHKIAHGERLVVDAEAFDDIRLGVLWCIEQFRDKVENAAVTRLYVRKSP
jgi:hypothetical protein